MSKKFKLAKPYNWLIFKIINPNLESAMKSYARGSMLDIGCGDKPYKDMARDYVKQHVGLDHEDTMHQQSEIDLYGTAYKIPCDEDKFDTVLCTDVLEHLEEPKDALKEAYRILKPGGYGIYTVPLFWHLHEEPRDFYRFTRHGLEYLFKINNFEIVQIKALTGIWVTLGQEFSYYLWGFSYRWKGLLKPIVLVSVRLVQWMAYQLNKVDSSEEYNMEYLAIVRKPLNK